MSNYVFVPQYGGQPAPMSGTDTSQRFELGLEVWARDMGQTNAITTAPGTANQAVFGGGVFRYCQGNDVGSSGMFVAIVSDSASKIAAAHTISNAVPVGIAAGALSATSVYGWVQVQGVCDWARVTSGGSCGLTVGAPVFVNTGTAGYVQGASAANHRLYGVAALQSHATDATKTTCSFYLNRPFILGATASN